MDEGLVGKVAVVTGGAMGIGGAVSRRLAGAGATVAVWDVDLGAAQELCASLGGDHLALEVDVSSTDDVTRAAEATRAALGDPNVLVNNAARATAPTPLIELDDEEWSKTLEVNLGGPFKCMRALAPAMVEARSGAIVNVASMTAFTGMKATPGGYAASKGGVVSLTYAAAAQLGQYGIRVNGVIPGSTLTGRIAKQPPERRAEVTARMIFHPDGGEARMAEPSEVADAVCFLASAQSAWITGSWVNCSGGQLFR